MLICQQDMKSGNARTATFVIPCLNEAETLREFLMECKTVFAEDANTEWAILVADNGSTDVSIQIAQEEDVAVLRVPAQGYGFSVHAGILAAKSEYVVFADADGTYAPSDAVRLLDGIRCHAADLAIGSRIRGTIEAGAMPWLHRHIGTPALSLLIRKLYRVPITDCNCGIRCVRRSAYEKWNLSGQGMEYASAMLIRAATAGAKVIEVPVTLRRGKPKRAPHLKTWRDGMRHLLTILAGAPGVFWHPGLALLGLSLGLVLPSFWGPFRVVGHVRFFGLHTEAISIVIGFYGAAFLSLALSLYAQAPKLKPVPKLAASLTLLREDILFWGLIAFFGAFVTGGGFALWQWSKVNYSDFDFLKFTLGMIYFTLIPATIALGVFQSHLQKRALL